jgi:repressor LexA
MTLTKKQKDVLYFICNFYKDHTFYPSYKDIKTYFKFKSDGTVRTYLEILEKKGFIKRHSKARAITITNNPLATPIIGSIKAGIPSEEIQFNTSTIEQLEMLKTSKNRFALKISGDSMKNIGIMEGDIAIIDKTFQVKNNDIIAAQINNEATLKRFVKTKNEISLHPENINYKPIILNKKDINIIIGKCIGVIRAY